MKCRRCGEVAVVDLPSHNIAFCADCFQTYFLKQITRGIESQQLFTAGDSILVALSGGKDSLSLMLALIRLGYKAEGLHIDLGIPHSSQAARTVVERFCAKHNLPLRVLEMEKEGLAIPRVRDRLNRPICSACGKIKRYYFNKTAMDEGFDVLATGHNLDDEIARLTSNTLRWDIAYLSDQGPALDAENPEGAGYDAEQTDAENAPHGFVRKVKPLWRLTEFETANFAFLNGIENHYAPCPYSKGATFTVYKGLWQDLEIAMPGRKIDFYQGFLERGKPLFAKAEANSGQPTHPCTHCGYPTSLDLCGVCRIREAVKQN